MAKTAELTKEETEVLRRLLESDPETLKPYLESLSMTSRAMDGKPVDTSTVVTRLVDPHNILERSRFPTYTTIQYQVYLRLLYKIYGEVAISCKYAADKIAEGLISYKGGSRSEWTEQLKHAGGAQESQNVYFGPSQQPQEPKRRFWQRAPKPEHQELKD